MLYHYDLTEFSKAFLRVRLGMPFRYRPSAAP